MGMGLSQTDLQSIKQLVDDSINERVPAIIEPLFGELNQLISSAFDETIEQIDSLHPEVDEVKRDLKYIKVAIHRLEARGTLRA